MRGDGYIVDRRAKGKGKGKERIELFDMPLHAHVPRLDSCDRISPDLFGTDLGVNQARVNIRACSTFSLPKNRLRG